MKLDKKHVVAVLEAEYMTGRSSLKTLAASLNCTPQRLNQIGILFIPGWRNVANEWRIRGRSASFRADNGGRNAFDQS